MRVNFALIFNLNKERVFKMGTAEIIIAADIALTRLINLVVDLANKDGDEATIDELKAKADEMDKRRADVIEKIRGH